MKGKLNWQDPKVVNIFDEVTLWSAPFGRLLLEHIPMKPNCKILDIGFGTGFPLLELSQRFGEGSHIYGMDIWEEGMARAKEKIEVLGINNVTIFNQSAESIPLENNAVDLVCSNLGVNNFDNKNKVLEEIFRVLKKGGTLAVTTNPIGTFEELFQIFDEVFDEINLNKNVLAEYIRHRGTKEGLIKDVERFGLKKIKTVSDKTNFRFSSALALFDHSLIRIGFLDSWEKLVEEKFRKRFFYLVQQKIDTYIKQYGIFHISVPMLYLEFAKE